MLAAAPVVAFLATVDAERAKRFFTECLGFALIEDGPYALVFSAGGTMLRVQRVAAFEPHPFTALGWQVTDIRRTVADLAANGIAFMRVTALDQDAAGIWWTPNGDGVAWFHDPDGNTLSLTQFAAQR